MDQGRFHLQFGQATEHQIAPLFAGRSIRLDARQMERTYWTREFGQVRWEEWKRDDYTRSRDGKSASEMAESFFDDIAGRGLPHPGEEFRGVPGQPVDMPAIHARRGNDLHRRSHQGRQRRGKMMGRRFALHVPAAIGRSIERRLQRGFAPLITAIEADRTAQKQGVSLIGRSIGARQQHVGRNIAMSASLQLPDQRKEKGMAIRQGPDFRSHGRDQRFVVQRAGGCQLHAQQSSVEFCRLDRRRKRVGIMPAQIQAEHAAGCDDPANCRRIVHHIHRPVLPL
ncbi:hypothetical protein [Sphingobium yanoikuyae]|uniref:hypothetical protein n=1 Tax=Sphingobium yanoikuyae TaxID=13690 RepID=UPI0028AFE91F|nr:hypothetical protein [Sphingobium yanoikuyae]